MRTYFATSTDSEKWWLSNQYNAEALNLKARELAASGVQDISTLLTHLACDQTSQKAESHPDERPEERLDCTPLEIRLINFCRHEYDADWRGFERSIEARLALSAGFCMNGPICPRMRLRR